MTNLASDDPIAVAAVEAIHKGNVTELDSSWSEITPSWRWPGSPTGEGCGTRTLLHVVTDWPGHFPNGAASVAVLVAAGADVNARFDNRHTETPLHWAASSDDVEVLDALLDAGADIEADGAVIAGGTPLTDATAFGQWNAARRLFERGAQATMWEAATMGLAAPVEACLSAVPPPSAEEVTRAFWGACHGGQQVTAELLRDRGADINWVGWNDLTPLDAAARQRGAVSRGLVAGTRRTLGV